MIGDLKKGSRRAAGYETEGVSQKEHPDRETRSKADKENFRDWFSRLQNRGSDLDHGERSDYAGTSWSGSVFGGRSWGGGRER